MGVEPNIPEVVKAAIEKAAVTLRSSAREYAPTPVKADRIISDIIEHLAPAITTLIADVRRQDAEEICTKYCSWGHNAVVYADHAEGWMHPDDTGRPRADCNAGPIHDLRKADEKA